MNYKKSRKGVIGLQELAYLVGAIGLIVLLLIAMNYIPVIWGYARSAFVTPSEDLLNAIECAYLRCKEGCESAVIEAIEFEGTDGTKNCKEHFCVEPGLSGKVCSKEAQENPVIVLLTEKGGITRESLSFIDWPYEKERCIILRENLGSLTGSPPWVRVQTEAVYTIGPGVKCQWGLPHTGPIAKACKTPNVMSECSAEYVIVDPGTYYVWHETRLLKAGSVVWQDDPR